MRRAAWIVGVCAAVCLLTGAPAMGQVTFYFSVDLGGDLDLSDPGNQGNELLDCGEVYTEPAAGLAINEDGSPPNLGYPYALGTALQPAPAQVGTSAVALYDALFDLDGHDSLSTIFEWVGPENPVLLAEGTGGIHFEPQYIALSFEDDGPPGWAVSGDVPTTAPADSSTEVFEDSGSFWVAPGGSWSPGTLTAVRDEAALGLAANPAPQANDDDVDSLDVDVTPGDVEWYFTVDHEASLGDDPGSIYRTNLVTPPGVNKVQVIDDVFPAPVPPAGPGFGLGVPQDTDLDAIEFVGVGELAYNEMFMPMPPLTVPPGQMVLCVLFSVDSDDPDTLSAAATDLVGDESGGLVPGTVYISNLLGQYIALADYSAEGDVDAIAVSVDPVPVQLMSFSVE